MDNCVNIPSSERINGCNQNMHTVMELWCCQLWYYPVKMKLDHFILLLH